MEDDPFISCYETNGTVCDPELIEDITADVHVDVPRGLEFLRPKRRDRRRRK